MLRALAALLCWLFALAAGAQGLLPVPELTARVIDQTSTLDAIQRQGLEDKLAAFEQGKGTQIAMLIVPTTQPEDIASYANRVANAWKIGRREVGDGVVVIVAKDDRKVRIEVAKTLEGAVPDLAARQIIDEAITPKFRQNDFAGGLHAAADQLIARISGEKLPEPQRRTREDGGGSVAGFDWFDLAIFLFFVVPVAAKVLRGIFGKLGPIVAGGGFGLLALVITSSIVIAVIAGIVALVMSLLSGGFGGGTRSRHGGPVFIPGGWSGGGGGGGGWGGSGGGFGSGGGGDFGGGGASGDW